jgi:hypothetical protein
MLAQLIPEELGSGRWMLGVVVLLFLLGVGAHGHTGEQVANGFRRREDFRSEHEGVAGWLVDLVVLQGAAPTGRDVGVVWFDDDRLYFLGNRTSFGLARGQVVTVRNEDWLPNDLHPPLTIVLDCDTPAGNLAVGLEVLPQTRNFRANRTGAALSEAIRGWLAASHSDVGQLPPLGIGPDAPTPFSLLKGAIQTTALWSAVLAIVVWASNATFWYLAPIWAIMALLLLISWGGVWIPRLRWRAWRD